MDFLKTLFLPSTLICYQLWGPPSILQSLHVTLPAIVNTSIVVLSRCVTRVNFLTAAILKRAVGHTPKSKTLDEVYLHPKATQMIEAFDKANQLVNDEVLTTTKA